jgi:hypothetical protein
LERLIKDHRDEKPLTNLLDLMMKIEQADDALTKPQSKPISLKNNIPDTYFNI